MDIRVMVWSERGRRITTTVDTFIYLEAIRRIMSHIYKS